MTSHLPLFPGYVFLRADAEGRLLALKTNRVVQSLEVRDQDRLWQDLRQINRLITSGAPVSPEDRLEPGTVVEICSGPLTGIKGTVLRGATGRRLVVQVDFIQRGASVVLDETTLVRVEAPRPASRN
jgi:transcription antitermination factor NusG